MFDLHKSIMISLKNKMGNNSIASKFIKTLKLSGIQCKKSLTKKCVQKSTLFTELEMITNIINEVETARCVLRVFQEKYITSRYVSWLNDKDIVRFSQQKTFIIIQ